MPIGPAQLFLSKSAHLLLLYALAGFAWRASAVSSPTLTTQTTTCITASDSLIATGTPGTVAGGTNESISATAAMMRNSLTGRRANSPMMVKTMEAPIVEESSQGSVAYAGAGAVRR